MITNHRQSMVLMFLPHFFKNKVCVYSKTIRSISWMKVKVLVSSNHLWVQYQKAFKINTPDG